MKVVAINGSPRKDGNTSIALKLMSEELIKEGIEVEIIQVGDKLLHGCIACGYCFGSENHQCVFNDDIMNEVSNKMREADGIILGSPTYYGGIAGTMKSFLDRAFYSSITGKNYRNKVATAVVSVRRAGGVDVYNQLNNYLSLAETVSPPSQYWVIGYGMDKGEILQDEEGIQTIKRNANAMAWLLKAIDSSTEKLPRVEAGTMTNFIR